MYFCFVHLLKNDRFILDNQYSSSALQIFLHNTILGSHFPIMFVRICISGEINFSERILGNDNHVP